MISTLAAVYDRRPLIIVGKVKGKDFDAAQTAYGTIEQSCVYCHFSHREKTASGFIIKP